MMTILVSRGASLIEAHSGSSRWPEGLYRFWSRAGPASLKPPPDANSFCDKPRFWSRAGPASLKRIPCRPRRGPVHWILVSRGASLIEASGRMAGATSWFEILVSRGASLIEARTTDTREIGAAGAILVSRGASLIEATLWPAIVAGVVGGILVSRGASLIEAVPGGCDSWQILPDSGLARGQPH